MSVPTLQIYSAIGFDPNSGTGLSAAEFGLRLAEAEASGEKRVAVRINSGGGSWQEGQSMYDMLKASALKVDTYCVGLVGSAATLPFMAGNKRLIAKHGKLMIHDCASMVAGQVADLENGITQQKAINHSMAQLYASASGQTVEKCAEMMRVTTYMDADTAVALGFATGFMPETTTAQAPPADLPTASLHSYYASILSATDMKNLLIPIFAAAGMSTVTANTSDADVATAVQAAFTERDKFKKDVADAEAKVKAAEATAKAATDELATATAKLKEQEDAATAAAAADTTAKVNALVDGAIAAGKITASQKDNYVVLATANLASTTAVLAAIPARKSLTDNIISANAEGVMPLTAAGAMLEVQAKLAGQ
ncbi:Clp protease ClpP [Hymenobacter negativus]|uniref:ATP-dependent Clp protease proteolytic subunit n=1 Tax=Hymenobacter negativus TaxID=2795026 RepID=A0ABS3QD71_9BACT|nr:Clp protease ClpP [Hymenobacter negativus]MBO2009180.1 ATP-dependent Clp protease proteolytic subunit [Hymenobacter negativus]